MELVNVQNLAIEYDGEYLFNNLSFNVQSGKRLVIIGPSGCGKSSIIKAILDQVEYEGEISINGDIGYMPQNLALLKHLTVEENVMLPHKVSKNTIDIKDDDYAHFGILDLKNRYIHELSGGQSQRVALMRAVYHNTPILCIDEPLSKLDQITKEQMVDFFKKNIDKDKAIIYVTHDLYEASTIADQILVLGANPVLIDNNLNKEDMVRKLRNLLLKQMQMQ